MVWIALLIAVVITVVFQVVQNAEVKKMTKDGLIEKCKKLIDSKKTDKVQRVLLSHPKLLLLHFNELQTVLTEYAREVENRSEINNGGN